MKKIQGWLLRFVVTSLCCSTLFSTLSAQTNPGQPQAAVSTEAPTAKRTVSAEALAKGTASAVALAKADSLFKIKQYTQSFEIYHSLFQQKKYSPAMLLRMAFIQEGLGHVSQSLYFLNLYYKTSHDELVLAKIAEVAARSKLEGYGATESMKLYAFLDENNFLIAGGLASMVVLMAAVSFYLKRRSKSALVPGVFLVFFLVLCFAQLNFSSPPSEGIVTNPATYLMSGPSAGARVVGIIGEGHQLEIIGQRDVWLKVKWKEKDAYVKESAVLEVEL